MDKTVQLDTQAWEGNIKPDLKVADGENCVHVNGVGGIMAGFC
jgi:hypothetical protein